MLRYALIYVFTLGAMFTLETTPAVQNLTVTSWTGLLAQVSVYLMHLIDARVVAVGFQIKSMDSGYSVAIRAGCNGVEASMVLAAAILAFPSAWGSKLLGIVSGVIVIQAANLLRIVTLFYIGQWGNSALTVAHLYIWPSLIILDVLIIFLMWIRWQAKHTRLA